MNNKNAVSKKVLSDHFAGRSTPLEKSWIEEWLTSPENIEFYFECLNTWENENIQYVADDLTALHKVKIAKNSRTVIITKKSVVRKLSKQLSVAAAILIVIGCTLFLEKDDILMKTDSTTYGDSK